MGAMRLARDEAWSLARDLVRAFAAEADDDQRLALFHELHAFLGPRLEGLLCQWEREWQRVGRAAVAEPPPACHSRDERHETEGTQHRPTQGGQS